jgi:transposase
MSDNQGSPAFVHAGKCRLGSTVADRDVCAAIGLFLCYSPTSVGSAISAGRAEQPRLGATQSPARPQTQAAAGCPAADRRGIRLRRYWSTFKYASWQELQSARRDPIAFLKSSSFLARLAVKAIFDAADARL